MLPQQFAWGGRLDGRAREEREITQIFEDLGDLHSSTGSPGFVGASQSRYGLLLEEGTSEKYIAVVVRDGDHSIVGNASEDSENIVLSFGRGSSDVWLSGDHHWEGVSILGGAGNHTVWIEKVGLTGAAIHLGDGASSVVLGTQIGDVRTTISGGNGSFRIEVGDAGSIRLGHGNHLINAGETSLISVGNGTSQIFFNDGNNLAPTLLTAGSGNHVIGATAIGDNSSARIVFGNGVDDGGSTVVLAGGDWKTSSVVGGAGNHTVVADDLGHVRLGNGDHYIDAGHAHSIRVGHGDSLISFTADPNAAGALITAGAGNHVVVGRSEGANTAATIALGNGVDGGGSIVTLSGGDWSTSHVLGRSGNHTIVADGLGRATLGRGDHHIDVGEADLVVVSDGNSAINFTDGTSAAGAVIRAGHGDHTIVGTANGSNAKANIAFGNGDTSVHLKDNDQDSFAGSWIVGGSGNNALSVSEVGFAFVGNGNDWVSFSDGADATGATVYTNAGDDFVVADAVGAATRSTVLTGSGNDTVVLLGDWNTGGYTHVFGGIGNDTLFVSSGTDIAPFAQSLIVREFETVVWIDAHSTIDNIVVLNDKNGVATGQVLNLSTPPAGRPPETDFDLHRETLLTEVEALQQERSGLAPNAAGDSAASALLAYISSDDGDAPTIEDATREGRLMESADDFFLRVDTYELKFSSDSANSMYSNVTYNDLGDFVGTNFADVMEDGNGNSEIFAMAGNDIIDGKDGTDRIFAGAGNDVIYGGDGQDMLDGGDGHDLLIGGRGIDVFIFRKDEGTTVIDDFELSYDILDVEGFENLTYEALTAAGRQDGDDVIYELGLDTLILRNVELATMQEIDLCMK